MSTLEIMVIFTPERFSWRFGVGLEVLPKMKIIDL